MVALGLQGEVDHHDRVLLDDADQQDDADQRDQAQLAAAEDQREQRADPGRGQGREDGQRVHVALVEDAEDDVHRQQRQEDQPGHLVLRVLHRAGVALEAGLHVHRDVQRLQGLHDGLAGRADLRARRQVEGQRGGGELALVVDLQRCPARFVVAERGQRHALAVVADHLDLAEDLRALLVLLVDLHHHPVLVQRVEDGRHLALAERVVEHRVDHFHVDPQGRRAVAVDHQAGLHALVLGVAVDVHQLRQLAHRRLDLRRPFAEQGQVVAAQGEFVLRVAVAAAQAHVLAGVEIERRAGHLGDPLAQPGEDLLHRVAFADRLEGDEERTGVARLPAAAADEADHVLHRRIGREDLAVLAHLRAQGLERDALVGHRVAAQAPGVLLREEALGHHHEQPEVHGDAGQHDHHHQPRVLQRPAQAGAVAQHEGGEEAIAPPRQGSALGPFQRTQQTRAEHRREGQGYHQGHQDRRREGHRELAEQPPGEPAHEQQRDEHRDQRERHRQHGETDLAGAGDRRLDRRVALLDAPGDVLHHHDGVVHHEAGGDDQRHQRQVVQAEVAQVHDREGADQRDRHRQAGDQRGAAVAQEQEDYQDHQRHRDQQGQLGLFQRRADRRAAIVHHVQLDLRPEQFLQHRQLRVDGVGGLDNVGAGLAGDDQQHRRQVVGEAGVAHVLHRVADLGHVAEAHRGAVVGVVVDHQRLVLAGLAQLVVGVHLPVLVVLLDGALGAVAVGRGDGRAHAVQG